MAMPIVMHSGSPSRFSLAQNAITKVLNNYGNFAFFGYAEFPGMPDQPCSGSSGCCGDCCASGVSSFVRPGDGLSPILGPLGSCSNQNTINCINSLETPTAQVIKKIDKAYASINRQTPPRYTLLLTGNEPSCTLDSSPDSPSPCEQTRSAINSMLMVDPLDPNSVSVSTFVVGIGDVSAGTSVTPPSGNDCLNRLALAGGHAPSAAPYYYVANADALVQTHINNIVLGTICHFDIDNSTSFDRAMVEVDFNGSMVTRDDGTNQNGWSLVTSSQGTSVVIYGPACDAIIQNMKVSSHQVVIKSCPDPHAS
jgi:hypothetical protein